MSVVLVGASGWLGGPLREVLGDVVPVPAREVLATDGAAVAAVLARGGCVVNAAGARGGDPDLMHTLNARLPEILADEVTRANGHLVHLGSAAEYGLGHGGGVLHEGSPAVPGSDYGRTKLAGTEAALASSSATVLRVFNVASAVPQAGTPLADILDRVLAANQTGTDVELLSADTVRDWVRRGFVARSVLAAVEHRPAGVFNVASGVGVRMGDAVEEAVRRLGSSGRVVDLGVYPASTVIGGPDRWADASGLRETVTAVDLGGLLWSAASGAAHGETEGKTATW